jgi:uncharacterized integral membrane protein
MHDQVDSGPSGQYGEVSEPRTNTTKLIIFLVAAVAAIVFIAQNRDKVTLHFLFFDISSRVWVGFVISLALGALLGALIGRWWKRRKLRQ